MFYSNICRPTSGSNKPTQWFNIASLFIIMAEACDSHSASNSELLSLACDAYIGWAYVRVSLRKQPINESDPILTPTHTELCWSSATGS